MADDLDRALEFLLDEEGGWSNNPADKGGATMYGVTQAVYTEYRKAKKLPQQSVRGITQAEAKEIYKVKYWQAAGCDRLPWPISYITFDAAVNSGVSRAVRWTQTGLGTKVDLQVGPNTVSAANRAVQEGDGKVLLSILDQRVSFLANLVKSEPSQAAFLLGWWRRTQRVLGRALTAEI